MSLRPYQVEFCNSVMASFAEYNRVLGVAATGAGKTVIAAELVRRSPLDNCLFLADAQELVRQTGEKFERWTGEIPQVEMADSRAQVGDRIVIATTQSIARRLDKWPASYFDLIIVDEAHRNSMGEQAQKVLRHFEKAKVVGITATPFRSDKKQLSDYFETVAVEVGLPQLIREGYLSRIRIKSVPLGIDLRGVRQTAGDYNDADLGKVLDPHLDKAAEMIRTHATGRRTVVFLPLIETSKRFVECCKNLGLKAVHVDGTDRAALKGDWDIICNSALLTTGWDQPDISCVVVLRPTRSYSLYSQMVGRGTRLHPGKTDLLVLDPLYLSDKIDLVRPARLLAHDEKEVASIQKQLDADPDGADLLMSAERAVVDREKAMREAIRKNAKKNSREVDAVEFALTLHAVELAEYEPEMKWEFGPPSDRQLESLKKAGFNTDSIRYKGHASKILDLIFRRRDMKLATPKQVKCLVRLGVKEPHLKTFEEAHRIMDARFGKKETTTAVSA